jgi:hypothetical protein
MARPIAEPEIHLIPDGFIGHVIVRHGVAGGAPMEREGDARVYRIPPDGVLETQAPANYGIREPAIMRFHYDGATRARLPVHRPPSDPAPQDEVAILGGYQVRAEFHYFVDTPRNADRYANPAIQPGEREPDPAARSEAFFRYALYPILFSRQPVQEVDRVARVLLEGLALPPTRDHLRSLVAEIRAELATPTRRLRDLLGRDGPAEDGVSEADVREFLRLLSDRISAALAAP